MTMLKHLLGKWATVVAGACEHDHGHRHAKCCDECQVGETACPPRCAGHVDWKLERGATAYATLEVRNAGSAARTFKFAGTALAGPEPGTAALAVTPATAMLQPGERAVVQVQLNGSIALQPLQSYFAEVLITGAWEQAVKIALHVAADPFSSVNLEHGDSIKDRLFELGQTKAAVAWTIQRGVAPKAVITIHNTASGAQTLELETGPLTGLDSGTASLTLSPLSLVLSPGQTGSATLQLQNTGALRPGQDYRSEVILRGDHEQRVAVKCHVAQDATAHCSVEQGDAPTRKRAHRWTDHFQCTDACAS
jgi:hypothetical protein